MYFRNASLIAALLVTIALTMSGCVTTDRDSDMPWASPEAWEGSVGIPGMQGR